MEFAPNLKSKLFFRKAGYQFDAFPAVGPYQHAWTGKYNVVGLNARDLPILTDGMNDQGLSTGQLWLPTSKYQEISDPAKGLTVDRFAMWLLSSFATVDEVCDALSVKKAVEVGAPAFLDDLLPIHFPVHDASGKSIVIEFIDHQMMVHPNPVGVLTNQPPFLWHLENLRNYIHLTPWDVDKPEDSAWNTSNEARNPMDGLTLVQTGHGSGMHGLPGDPTPPSRFIKAAFSSHFASAFDTADEGVMTAFHILNSVDIPKGLNRFKSDIPPHETTGDYPQWVVVKDLKTMTYYVRMFDATQVYSVDLHDVDWQAMDGKQLAIPTDPISVDLMKRTDLSAEIVADVACAKPLETA